MGSHVDSVKGFRKGSSPNMNTLVSCCSELFKRILCIRLLATKLSITAYFITETNGKSGDLDVQKNVVSPSTFLSKRIEREIKTNAGLFLLGEPKGRLQKNQ